MYGKAMTPSERNAERSKRGARRVMLPPQAVADLEAIKARDGDKNVTQANVRVLREARERG